MKRKTPIIILILTIGIFLLPSFSTVQAGRVIQKSIPGFDCYRDLPTVQSTLQTMAAQYPQLAEIKTIGYSWEGEPIHALKLTNRSVISPKPALVLVSGLRGNAFAPVELSLQFAEKMLNDYGSDSENGWLLDHFELHLIAVANPDGRVRAESQAQAQSAITWQNNTHNTCDSEDIGVRLNQNFGFNWRSSTTGPCDPAFPGISAISEPETQAIAAFLDELSNRSEPVMLIHLDSYQNEMLSPYLSDPTAVNPHDDDLYTLADKIAFDTLAIPFHQGEPDHQPTYGTLVDYAYGSLGAPSLVFRMGDPMAGGYSSSCWYFNNYLLEKNLAALVRALKISADPYRQSYGPEIADLSYSQDMNSVHVEGKADDYSYWFEGADVYSQVKSAWFSIDTPPWQPQAIQYPIANLIPAIDFPYTAYFNLDIDYSLITPGEHRIFFQAWDQENGTQQSNPGLVSAIDVFVPYRHFLPITIKR